MAKTADQAMWFDGIYYEAGEELPEFYGIIEPCAAQGEGRLYSGAPGDEALLPKVATHPKYAGLQEGSIFIATNEFGNTQVFWYNKKTDSWNPL